MTDYHFYKLKRDELIRYYLAACILLALLGLLFYRNLVMAAFCSLAAIPLKRFYADHLKKKRLEKLQEGFKDALYSISGSVAAGRQLPIAIREAAGSVSSAYGEDADITAELKHIAEVYTESHGDAYGLLSDFGYRSGLEEISQFAQSCSICRRCGGDMEAVALKSASLLLDRMELNREIKGLISQKKTDIALLTLMPVAVLGFLNLVSFSYLEPLYTGAQGRIIMSCCLAVIGFALLWCIRDRKSVV